MEKSPGYSVADPGFDLRGGVRPPLDPLVLFIFKCEIFMLFKLYNLMLCWKGVFHSQFISLKSEILCCSQFYTRCTGSLV